MKYLISYIKYELIIPLQTHVKNLTHTISQKNLNIYFNLNNISVHPLLKSYFLLKIIRNCVTSLVSIIYFMCNMKKIIMIIASKIMHNVI
jgi:hypothetical protein